MNYNKYIVAVLLGIVGMTVSNLYAMPSTPLVVKQKIAEDAYEHKILGFTKEGNYLVQYYYLTGEKMTDVVELKTLNLSSVTLTDLNTLIAISAADIKVWYKNGQLRHQVINLKDTENYKEFIWHPNGQKKYEIIWKDGQQVAEASWYLYGQKEHEKTWKDGQLIVDVSWYLNGKKKNERIWKSGRLINEIAWYEDGQKATDFKANGDQSAWYLSGKIRAESYREGKQHKTTQWYENGYKKLESTMLTVNSWRFSFWNERGILLSDTLNVEGKPIQYLPVVTRKLLKETAEGYLVQDFYKNNKKYSDPYWLTHKNEITNHKIISCEALAFSLSSLTINGLFVQYNDLGQKICEVNYAKGQVVDYTSFYEDGKRKREYHYQQGKLVTEREWSENGQLMLDDYVQLKLSFGWYEDGAKLIHGRFNPKTQQLVTLAWHKNGVLSTKTYQDENGNGVSIKWNEQGGLLSEYHSLLLGLYVKYVSWSSNPAYYKVEQYAMVGDVSSTIDSFWKSNRRLYEIIEYSKESNKFFKITAWYENEQVAVLGQSQRNGKYGKWKYFYEDGKPYMQGEFLKDKQVGTWTYWDEEGNKTTEEKTK